MSRVVKFRGKSGMTGEQLDELKIQHDNGWVIGSLIADGNTAYIVDGIAVATDEYIHPNWWVPVDPKTVGQFTGLHDKNGVEIYERDIVEYTRIIYADCSRTEIEDIQEPVTGNVYYAEGIWLGVKFADGTGKLFLPGQVSSEVDNSEIEVIGNIYENLELLEASQ